jgi:hypothetical protein
LSEVLTRSRLNCFAPLTLRSRQKPALEVTILCDKQTRGSPRGRCRVRRNGDPETQVPTPNLGTLLHALFWQPPA